jgi:hypothetical protein
MPPSKKMSGHEIRRELLGDDLFRRNEGIYNNEVMKEFSELTNVTIFENIWVGPAWI